MGSSHDALRYAAMGRTGQIISATIASVLTAAALATSAGGADQTTSDVGPGTRAHAAIFAGKKCIGHISSTREKLTLVNESHWDTDSWKTRPPHEICPTSTARSWESQGGAFRGCHNHVTYSYDFTSSLGTHFRGTLEFSVSKPYHGQRSHRCEIPTGHGLRCEVKDVYEDDSHVSVYWNVEYHR
jgi:hypothetical protein